jgi:hypothetical protein
LAPLPSEAGGTAVARPHPLERQPSGGNQSVEGCHCPVGEQGPCRLQLRLCRCPGLSAGQFCGAKDRGLHFSQPRPVAIPEPDLVASGPWRAGSSGRQRRAGFRLDPRAEAGSICSQLPRSDCRIFHVFCDNFWVDGLVTIGREVACRCCKFPNTSRR